MNILDAMTNRHSVRKFTNEKISDDAKKELEDTIKERGLNITLCIDEPEVFGGFSLLYGRFKNAKNYIVLFGKDNEEESAYVGAELMLKAQQLGLNSCFVAATYKSKKVPVILKEGEKIHAVIALGYGKTEGTPHKSKSIHEVSNAENWSPEWFLKGVRAALLAPTAMNKQDFVLALIGENKVKLSVNNGEYTKLDTGIIKYYFEAAAEKNNFKWF